MAADREGFFQVLAGDASLKLELLAFQADVVPLAMERVLDIQRHMDTPVVMMGILLSTNQLEPSVHYLLQSPHSNSNALPGVFLSVPTACAPSLSS